MRVHRGSPATAGWFELRTRTDRERTETSLCPELELRGKGVFCGSVLACVRRWLSTSAPMCMKEWTDISPIEHGLLVCVCVCMSSKKTARKINVVCATSTQVSILYCVYSGSARKINFVTAHSSQVSILCLRVCRRHACILCVRLLLHAVLLHAVQQTAQSAAKQASTSRFLRRHVGSRRLLPAASTA